MRGLREFWLDSQRHLKRSSPSNQATLGKLTGRHLEGQLTKDYHRVEKGLSLAEPKRPFGEALETRLSALLDAPGAVTQSASLIAHVETSIAALRDWNDRGLVADEVSPPATPRLEAGEMHSPIETRRSVRNFDPDAKVAPELIREAVRLAGLSPSVCNRQPWRTYAFTESADVRRVLRHHSGNAGFGTDAAGVFIVTVDLRLFSGAGERNQRWIDGGMFAMSLVLACEQLGVSTCMLNWSRDNASSRALKSEAKILDDEDVVVLIAFGYPRSGYRVARSPRRPVDDLLVLPSLTGLP